MQLYTLPGGNDNIVFFVCAGTISTVWSARESHPHWDCI